MGVFFIRTLNIANLILGGFLVAIVGMGSAGVFDEYARTTAAAKEAGERARTLEERRRTEMLALLVGELETLKQQVAEIKNEGQAAGARQRETISALEEKIEQSSRDASSIAPLAAKWRKRRPSVPCRWLGRGGRVAVEFQGSGVAVADTRAVGGNPDASFGIVTCKHLVVNDHDDAADSCLVRLPDNPATYTVRADQNSIAIAPTSERAILVVRNHDAAFRNVIVRSYCTAQPLSGDRVAVLGYPRIGSAGDVTATEGIISGFEGEYYITSAKIEQGNSGGAAILVKRDCYLGIPSFVKSGGLESLGRILRHAAIR